MKVELGYGVRGWSLEGQGVWACATDAPIKLIDASSAGRPSGFQRHSDLHCQMLKAFVDRVFA
jgi:hypothetical protein